MRHIKAKSYLNVSGNAENLIFTAKKKLQKNRKRSGSIAILEKITETKEINFALRYIEDRSRTSIAYKRVVNNIITATGLDSFYLKSGGKFISGTLLSEPSPFPNSQNLLDFIYKIPKIKRAYVESKKYFSLKA